MLLWLKKAWYQSRVCSERAQGSLTIVSRIMPRPAMKTAMKAMKAKKAMKSTGKKDTIEGLQKEIKKLKKMIAKTDNRVTVANDMRWMSEQKFNALNTKFGAWADTMNHHRNANIKNNCRHNREIALLHSTVKDLLARTRPTSPGMNSASSHESSVKPNSEKVDSEKVAMSPL